MGKIKCDAIVDCGPSRVRGLHNSKSCSNPAKYRITYKNGEIKNVCGVHKNSEVFSYQFSIEKIEKL